MKIMNKNALEVKGRKRKGSWRAQCPRSDGRVARGGDTGSGRGQPERRRAQPGRGHPEGERGAGGCEHSGLELSQGIWAKSQGKGKRKVSVLGGMGY